MPWLDTRPFYSLGVVSRAYIVCRYTFILAMRYFFFSLCRKKTKTKVPMSHESRSAVLIEWFCLVGSLMRLCLSCQQNTVIRRHLGRENLLQAHSTLGVGWELCSLVLSVNWIWIQHRTPREF